MIIHDTSVPGVALIEPDRKGDDRGYFARTFCVDEFASYNLPTRFVQCSLSFNHKKGTLRGLHWQAAPFQEGKLVRCTRGTVFDVAVDLRQGSDTLYRWVAAELSAENGCSLYVPAGFAHGFQTVEDESEVFYQMTEMYHPGLARGARWDDPLLAIDWPVNDPIMSDRDRTFDLLAGESA